MEKKFLYFGQTADDTGSTEEIIMVPVENVSHWEVAGTAALDVFFKVNIGQEAMDMDAGTADFNKVRLVVTAGAGNMKSVLQSIAGAINATHSDGLIVIADDENSVYCNPLITSINAITILDAS
jgi:hypothetical protein|tara:strand:+ start:128 stop:499 length:372 start_codon:yes stop_codon:yes gene_type:complete